jgi:uncharacterized membrane protein YfcA
MRVDWTLLGLGVLLLLVAVVLVLLGLDARHGPCGEARVRSPLDGPCGWGAKATVAVAVGAVSGLLGAAAVALSVVRRGS